MDIDNFLKNFYEDNLSKNNLKDIFSKIGNLKTNYKYQTNLLKEEFGEEFENDKKEFLKFLDKNPRYLDINQYPFGMIAGYLMFKH